MLSQECKNKYNSLCKCLSVSGYLFLIPVFLGIYSNRVDIPWIYTSITVTSIYRWGYPEIVLYQYIDHNWVKFVYICAFISTIRISLEGIIDEYSMIYMWGVLLTIPCIFITSTIIHFCGGISVSICMHMLLHFYSVILGIIFLLIPFNIHDTVYSLKNGYKVMCDIWNDVIRF